MMVSLSSLTPGQRKKLKAGKCITSGCRNKHRVKKRYCGYCVTKKYRQDHPIRYAYMTLRDNAKRRKKFFDLTFEQFSAFVAKNNYMELKGRTAQSLSIDRERNELGYTATNIRAITLSENDKKRNYVDYPGKQMGYDPECGF